MPTQSKIKAVVIAVLMFGISSDLSQGNDTCSPLKDRLDKETDQLVELNKSYSDLNQKFEDSVQQDFTAQTEGLLDDLRRNEAVKLAFARKKLGRVLESKRESVKHLRALYCPKCIEKESKENIKPGGRCFRCPEEKACQTEE